jgi:hypothetical protein
MARTSKQLPKIAKKAAARQVTAQPTSSPCCSPKKADGPLGRGPLPPSFSLLFDALNSDDAEARKLATKFRYILLLFLFECLKRVHIREL